MKQTYFFWFTTPTLQLFEIFQTPSPVTATVTAHPSLNILYLLLIASVINEAGGEKKMRMDLVKGEEGESQSSPAPAALWYSCVSSSEPASSHLGIIPKVVWNLFTLPFYDDKAHTHQRASLKEMNISFSQLLHYF